MTELSQRLISRLDNVLDETCRELPNGGDHDTRKFIAKRLLEAASNGRHTLGELGIIARKAAADAKIDLAAS